MVTDTTEHSLKKDLQDWKPGTVVVAAVLVFALCVAIFAAVQAPPHQTIPARKAPAPLVAEMPPVIPWNPVRTVKARPEIPAHREGPYTLRPDAPMLESEDAFIFNTRQRPAPGTFLHISTQQ